MSKKVRKGGRPRKSGARKPSGDLRPAVDHGSEYLLARRAAVGDAKDTRTSYVLGVLMLEGDINAKQHYAGRRYWRLYRSAAESGGANVKSCLANLVGGSGGGQPSGYGPAGGSDFDDALLMSEYRAAHQAVASESQTTLNLVEAVALFEVNPAPHQLDRLRRGLDLLYIHFKGGDRPAEDFAEVYIDEAERLKAAAQAADRVEADPEKKAWLEQQREARRVSQGAVA